MPIIDHAEVRWAPTLDRVRERYLVSKAHGTVSLTIKEVEIAPGGENHLHTHPVDVSIQVMAGAIQALVGEEVRTVRAGTTLVIPPGVPHQLLNHLWTSATLLVTYPSAELETEPLD
jgi:quercetin dioxygenase-like cupin family protein